MSKQAASRTRRRTGAATAASGGGSAPADVPMVPVADMTEVVAAAAPANGSAATSPLSVRAYATAAWQAARRIGYSHSFPRFVEETIVRGLKASGLASPTVVVMDQGERLGVTLEAPPADGNSGLAEDL